MLLVVLMVLVLAAGASASVAAPMPLLEKDPQTSPDFVADLAWRTFGRPYGFKVFVSDSAFTGEKPRCFFELRVNGGEVVYCEALDASRSTETSGFVWQTSEKEPFLFVPGTITFRARFVTEKGINLASLWKTAYVNKDGTVVPSVTQSTESTPPPRYLEMKQQFFLRRSEKGDNEFFLEVSGLVNFGPLTKPEDVFFSVKGAGVPGHSVPAVLPAEKDSAGNHVVTGHIFVFAWDTDMEVKVGYKESATASAFSAPYLFHTPKEKEWPRNEAVRKTEITQVVVGNPNGFYDRIEITVPAHLLRENNLGGCEIELSEKAGDGTKRVETRLVDTPSSSDWIYSAKPELKPSTGYLMRSHICAPVGKIHYVSDWLTFSTTSDMKIMQQNPLPAASPQPPDPALTPPGVWVSPSPVAPPMPSTLGKSISEVVAYQVAVIRAFRASTELVQPGSKEQLVQAREYLIRAEVLQRIILQHIESDEFRRDLEGAHSALCAEMEFLKQKVPALRGGEQLFKIYVAPGLPPVVQPQAAPQESY